jgi:hypothetical protein
MTDQFRLPMTQVKKRKKLTPLYYSSLKQIAIHRIHVTERFSEILSDAQLDDVHCAALNLSTAVTEYLVMVIQYLTDKSIGNLVLQFPTR